VGIAQRISIALDHEVAFCLSKPTTECTDGKLCVDAWSLEIDDMRTEHLPRNFVKLGIAQGILGSRHWCTTAMFTSPDLFIGTNDAECRQEVCIGALGRWN